MKLKINLTEEKRNTIALLIITTLLIFYDYVIVYPYIEHISRKLLFIDTVYNSVVLFALSMTLRYGGKNLVLRNTMMSLSVFSTISIVISLLILRFPYSDRIYIALLIITVILLAMKPFIDTLIGVKKLIKH